MYTLSIKEAFETLQKIYDLLPATRCEKSSCASWCCTKLKNSMDGEANFMPLPMVYSLEFLNIEAYLKETKPQQKIDGLFDFSKKTRLCPFKDPHSPACQIYPVRPLSCRLYGRKIPPILWGIEITPEEAKIIYCDDVTVLEPHKLENFEANYTQIWQIMTQMSSLLSPFSEEQRQMIEKETGLPTLILLGFGEFLFLKQQSLEWFKKHFSSYWKIYEKLL